MNKLPKILFIFTLSLFLPLALFAQSGDGSSGNPFYGTISSSTTWDWENIGDFDGKIYIGTAANNDLTIGSGGHLTILPGATLIFTQTTSDMIITATGRITADATPGTAIKFTKASGNGNWGHIIFDGMSGSNISIIDNCIIEFGKKTGTTLIFDNVGGGICANYSYVTIQNCTFKDNYALFGGGLFIGYDQSPTIERNIFLDNESREAGGGIYVYNESDVIINNCIFDGNLANGVTSSSYGGGGIQFGINTSNAKVVNSTFVNNTALRSGNGAYFYTGGSADNCIFWGSNDEIVFRTSFGSASNCAVQDFVDSSHFTDCIDLNSSNSAANGPNFYETDGTDWSVKFVSPCRDAGTATGAPPTDYNGDSRIGTTDIGAFEVLYSRWDGSAGTSWGTASNWEQNITPSVGASDVIIPSGLSNYPTSTGANHTIGNGNFLILEAGSQTTFSTLTNSGGTLEHLSDVSGIASLMFDSYSDAGTETFEMFISGGSIPDHKWHYIAVPGSMNKSAFTSINALNLLEFDDAEIVSTNMEGWQWHDGYDNTNSFTTLQTKKGYNFYHTQDVTVSLPTVTGLLNSMGSSVALQFNGNGLNLIGNSLTCSIDWDEVVTSGDMRDAVYFTKDNSQVSYVSGVGTPMGTTGIIPPLQGFMVKANELGCTIDFSGANVKTHGTVNRYKSGTIIPLVRVTINNNEYILDETVVRLDNFATTEFDNEYDASKLFSVATEKTQIFSNIGTEKYSINGIPFPDVFYSQPLTLKIMEDGDYSIKKLELNGLDHYKVVLRDLQEDFSIDLSAVGEYNFSSVVGTIDNRFVLEFTPLGVGTEDILEDFSEFKAYSYSGTLNILANDRSWENTSTVLNVYDLTGRRIISASGLEWYRGETKQFGFNKPSGIYIVEISDGVKRSVQKISHR